MTLPALVSRQRVSYIIESYQLQGDADAAFTAQLNQLLDEHAHALIELALIEVLIANWVCLPMEKGLPYLEQVRTQLEVWQDAAVVSSVSPGQFEQIAGLDATLVFSSAAAAVAVPYSAVPESPVELG